ncbi:hypothetical protein [Eubacterium sp. AF17-7]|nr:hypothetical protein [Eubacterium sp. AF17-7]
MIKLIIVAITVIVAAGIYSLCIMRFRDDRRRERDARSWDED